MFKLLFHLFHVSVLGHYIFCNNVLYWYNAHETCRRNGFALTKVDSEAKQQDVLKFIEGLKTFRFVACCYIDTHQIASPTYVLHHFVTQFCCCFVSFVCNCSYICTILTFIGITFTTHRIVRPLDGVKLTYRTNSHPQIWRFLQTYF